MNSELKKLSAPNSDSPSGGPADKALSSFSKSDRKAMRKHMMQNGFEPSKSLTFLNDGLVHQFQSQRPRHKSKSCWYLLTNNQHLIGIYGCSGTEEQYWVAGEGYASLDECEQVVADKMREDARRDYLEQVASQIAIQSRKYWRASKSAIEGHTYSDYECVRDLRPRTRNGKLVIPLRDWNGKIWNCVKVGDPDIEVYFPGARKLDCFCQIGGEIKHSAVIVEGFAEAVTICSALKIPTLMVPKRAGLKKMANSLRTEYPLIEIYVALPTIAINDKKSRRHVLDAVSNVNGRLIVPKLYDGSGATSTSFFELAKVHGRKALRTAFANAKTVVPPGGCSAHAMPLDTLLSLPIKASEILIGPWLRVGGLAMIHGWRGIGKSLLRDALAAHLVTGSSFLKWEILRPVSVLVVDGELPAADVRERIKKAVESLGKKRQASFRVITNDLLPHGPIDMREKRWQDAIEREAGGSEIIFLDNVATLAGDSADTNDAQSWASIQRWMTKMRAKNRAVIWFHNDGKGGTQLGTATRETVLDVSVQLAASKKKTMTGTSFKVIYTKPRWFFGPDRLPFDVVLESDAKGHHTWSASDSAPGLSKGKKDKILKLHQDGKSMREIETLTKISKSTISRYIQSLKQDKVEQADSGR